MGTDRRELTSDQDVHSLGKTVSPSTLLGDNVNLVSLAGGWREQEG